MTKDIRMLDHSGNARTGLVALLRVGVYVSALTVAAFGLVACGGAATSAGVSAGGAGAGDASAPSVSITSPSGGATLSGTVTVTATAFDNVGVAGVQFKLDGNNLGSEVMSSPFSVSWNTLAAAAGSHNLTAIARDSAGNRTASATVSVVVANSSSAPLTPLTSQNVIKIYDSSGTTQTNRPVSIARPFRQGDIAHCALAKVDGTSVLTQTDVKNRWSDGSLKFAIVSFIVSSLPANGSVTVTFSDQTCPSNTGLTKAQMLDPAFDFDGTIQMTGASTQTVSARDMLTNDKFRYWLQGPIVTAVILEDRTTARAYDKDFGDGSKALHPIFEAWFYPQGNKVELGYTVENVWASSNAANGMRDLSYSLVLTAGSASPAVEYTQASFNHIGRTRWHKTFWLGADPAPVRIDYNKVYLVTTHAIPKYDTNLAVADSLVASEYSQWLNADKSLPGSSTTVGSYSKALGDAGSHPWIGLMDTWDTIYLLTMDNRMREKSLGNADLIGRIPWHFREADTQAGSGHFFDNPGTGSVDTFGRVVSVNARVTVTLSQLDMDSASTCANSFAADTIKTGTISTDGWGFYDLGRHHMPDVAYVPYLMTGHYYYLEELQMEAAYMVGWKVGCFDANWQRHGDAGYFNDGETRGNAWAYRTVAYAAFISPDGTPEKAYFEDKLLNNIVKDEGRLGLTNSVPAKQVHWDWGKANQQYATGPSPLGLWHEGETEFATQSAVKQDGSVARALPIWQQHFVVCALGMARDFGYPSEPILTFSAKQMFGQLLNPATAPYLIEVYQTASILTATNDWIPSWDQVNQYHDVPTAWRTDDDIDHGYGYIALGALTFLYPYTVDGFTGQQAWNFFKAAKPGQDRFATESPKWAILP